MVISVLEESATMNLILFIPVLPILFQFLAWTISLAWDWATSAFSTASTADTEQDTANTSTAENTAAGDLIQVDHSPAENTAASDFIQVDQQKFVELQHKFVEFVLKVGTTLKEQAAELELAQKEIADK